MISPCRHWIETCGGKEERVSIGVYPDCVGYQMISPCPSGIEFCIVTLQVWRTGHALTLVCERCCSSQSGIAVAQVFILVVLLVQHAVMRIIKRRRLFIAGLSSERCRLLVAWVKSAAFLVSGIASPRVHLHVVGMLQFILWHKPAELAHSILFCPRVCFCLYGSFNCISFNNSSRQLCAFSTLFSPSYVCLIGPFSYISLWKSPSALMSSFVVYRA